MPPGGPTTGGPSGPSAPAPSGPGPGGGPPSGPTTGGPSGPSAPAPSGPPAPPTDRFYCQRATGAGAKGQDQCLPCDPTDPMYSNPARCKSWADCVRDCVGSPQQFTYYGGGGERGTSLQTAMPGASDQASASSGAASGTSMATRMQAGAKSGHLKTPMTAASDQACVSCGAPSARSMAIRVQAGVKSGQGGGGFGFRSSGGVATPCACESGFAWQKQGQHPCGCDRGLGMAREKSSCATCGRACSESTGIGDPSGARALGASGAAATASGTSANQGLASAAPQGPCGQLQCCCVKILCAPMGIAKFVHCWLEVRNCKDKNPTRWDVWQSDSWSKLIGDPFRLPVPPAIPGKPNIINVKVVGADVGHGPPTEIYRNCEICEDDKGNRLDTWCDCLEREIPKYEYGDRYWPIEGPNSNTFVGRMANRCGIRSVSNPPKNAHGWDYVSIGHGDGMDVIFRKLKEEYRAAATKYKQRRCPPSYPTW